MKGVDIWAICAIAVNVFICIVNLVQSIIFYKINKKNSNKSSLFSSIQQLISDCENYSACYWCNNLQVDERRRVAELLKTSIKKTRSTLTILGKKYIKKDIIIDLQNDWGEIDKIMTGGNFETNSFKIDPKQHHDACELLVKFREKIIDLS